MINVRHLTPNDNLEKAADLIWQVDPYICPDFFGDEERAKKFGKILFKNDGGLFDFDHILVAEDTEEPGKLLGILIYTDNKITSWDCEAMRRAVESLGIEIPQFFDRANKEYMELVVNEAKTLPDGVAEIEFLATDIESRGKGVAQAVFETFLALPQYHEQHLTVLADNPPAIRLYEKLGFQTVSTQNGYPDNSVETHHMVRKNSDTTMPGEVRIPIEVSARHVHLSQHLIDVLFGEGYKITPLRALSQPTEFLSNERIDIVGQREILHNVAILGPAREHTQVEISLTDARKLGLNPPIRESGNHNRSASCRLVGPVGEFELQDGVIVARRHIHMSPADAERLGVNDGDFVSVEVKDALRPVVFKDTLVRVKDSFILSMHIDTDESNAAGLTADSYGLIVK
ncbi:phosphate propanoyltransferase [Candidatus Saccharibacteria bacterium]|nr:phosphate propanoyltransferase [Candidatus Saccharibacteria bacterium]